MIVMMMYVMMIFHKYANMRVCFCFLLLFFSLSLLDCGYDTRLVMYSEWFSGR